MYKRGEYIYIIILVGLAVSPLHGYDMKPFIARFDSPSTFLGLEYCPNDQALLIIKHESQQSRYNNPESGTHSSFRLIKKKKVWLCEVPFWYRMYITRKQVSIPACVSWESLTGDLTWARSDCVW